LAVLAATLTGLWASNIPLLMHAWRSDPTASCGPLILIIACGLAYERWARKEAGADTDPVPTPLTALPVVIGSGLVYMAAAWLDIVVVRIGALLSLSIGVAGYLDGARTYRSAAAVLGFLGFAIPWPTSVTSGLAFPLQMASSSYAAQLAGMLGMNVVRHGVQLAVFGHGSLQPLYAITIAAPCSGLTSTTVLLALGYLIAYRTPAPMYVRALLMAAVIPVSLACNAVRLTLVLAAGAYVSPGFGGTVHDHEAPILVSMCCLTLIGIRWLILRSDSGPEAADG
jgi:exosortase